MKTILLADDDREHLNLLCATLSDPAHRIVMADNGIDALALVAAERPDVLVLDYQMPGMDGLDVAIRLRQDPATASIPFIMLTGVSREKEQRQLLALGARAYLVKPFSPLRLLDEVRKILGGSEPPGAVGSSRLPPPSIRRHRHGCPLAASLSSTGLVECDGADCPSAEVCEELESGRSQLAMYARDLKRVVAAERRRSRELAEANARLERLDRLKTDFLSFVSHELRTPLQVMSVIEMPDMQRDPKRQAMQFDLFRQGYDRLRQFVDRGLKYFGWLSREAPDPYETTDLVRALAELAGTVPELSAPGVDFRVDIPGPRCLVWGHPRHLGDVFEILLDNALKFSPYPKVVSVEAQVLPHRVIVTVSDDGVGFPPEMAHEILRPFTVVDVDHHSRGTGLSLALAAAIIHAYGGRLEALSEGPGHGATFRVELCHPAREPVD